MKLFQASTGESLRRNPTLRGQSLRVFVWSLSVVAWGNRLPAPATAAKQLCIQRTAAHRAYHELLEAELILKHGKDYYLNPTVAWKGTEAGLEAACRMLFHLGPAALAPGGSTALLLSYDSRTVTPLSSPEPIHQPGP